MWTVEAAFSMRTRYLYTRDRVSDGNGERSSALLRNADLSSVLRIWPTLSDTDLVGSFGLSEIVTRSRCLVGAIFLSVHLGQSSSGKIDHRSSAKGAGLRQHRFTPGARQLKLSKIASVAAGSAA
jgi:hypothetical protein